MEVPQRLSGSEPLGSTAFKGVGSSAGVDQRLCSDSCGLMFTRTANSPHSGEKTVDVELPRGHVSPSAVMKTLRERGTAEIQSPENNGNRSNPLCPDEA